MKKTLSAFVLALMLIVSAVSAGAAAEDGSVMTDEDAGKCYDIAVAFLDEYYGAVYGNEDFEPEITVCDENLSRIIEAKVRQSSSFSVITPLDSYEVNYSLTDVPIIEADKIYYGIYSLGVYHAKGTSFMCDIRQANYFTFRKTEDGTFVLERWLTAYFGGGYEVALFGMVDSIDTLDQYYEWALKDIDYSEYVESAEAWALEAENSFGKLRTEADEKMSAEASEKKTEPAETLSFPIKSFGLYNIGMNSLKV